MAKAGRSTYYFLRKSVPPHCGTLLITHILGSFDEKNPKFSSPPQRGGGRGGVHLLFLPRMLYLVKKILLRERRNTFELKLAVGTSGLPHP
jgi:hypothetical protein